MQSSGPQQEVAGILPNNFSLGPTKAESKGEENLYVLFMLPPLGMCNTD